MAAVLSFRCERAAAAKDLAASFPSQAVLHDIEKLLLGVDGKLGVDGPAVGVGGVAGDVELGADEADVAAAGEQGEDLGSM